MKHILLYFSVVLLITCKSKSFVNSSANTGEQVNTSSCTIEATVINILKPASTDSTDVCFKNPCKAIIHLDKINRCGSATTLVPDEKGELKVHFAYTLNPTKDLFPTMKTTYPGLKQGSHFTAAIEERQVLGYAPEYIIFSYQVK
jgi:hypothetical protein